jgi:beta-galactosidase
MARFTYQGKQFYLDGKEFVLRSGAMHYFRIPKEYWRDRLLKLKECGFNCVETYIAWNYHEEQEGVFDFEKEKDFGEFLDIAKELGLLAIVRPGPYICAEWNSGGLPFWLFSQTAGEMRCDSPVYMQKLTKYLENVFALICPRVIDNGGNVIMLQVENEYGSYGNDAVYLSKLVKIYRELGANCLLFTADGPAQLFKVGTVEGCLPFWNFGSEIEERMKIYDELELPDTPRVCAEFWGGWFDHWGETHHVRPNEEVIREIETFIKNDYGFNMYMFHGGTNFGFWNGCNYKDEVGLLPTTTSYDYDAPLTESGDRTELYYSIRSLFEKYGVDVPPLTATESEKRAYGKVCFEGQAPLFPQMDKIGILRKSIKPMTMEECGQEHGYIVYRTCIGDNLQGEVLTLKDVADRAIVFLDDKRIGEYYPKKEETQIVIDMEGKKSATLTVLVENEGRINYGPYIGEHKGMKTVLGRIQMQFGWENISLPMDDLSSLCFAPYMGKQELACQNHPTFFKGSFIVDTPADTFLLLDGFSKGFVTINGFNLGRYNKIGPQKTLYLPKTLLKNGKNEMIVFDIEGTIMPSAELIDKAILG